MSGPVRLVAVLGPTATGKSDLAVELATRLGGEVLNADAMQLYRGMDIGTAKLTVAQRRGVPHHLLDVLDVTETASVAAYQRDARAIVERLLAAGRTPVLAGGSALYLRAVLDEMSFPGTDPRVRRRLEHELAEDGADALHARLARLDPETAAAVPVANGRRIVRALEVIEITGRPPRASLPELGPPRYDAVLLGLDMVTEELDRRIERRVERMFAAGLVDEVRGLVGVGLREGRTASRAVGYQQVLAALDGGGDLGDFEVAAAETARATRRLVRRQRSWFRRDARIEWLDASEDPVGAALRGLRSGVAQ
ncbi:tRNA (adenosine(37)-N6)-dimethylallyltransferase MiaA [Pseudonocardia acaciae]|uniref:tRNA (adenosine(37)-N6)-dimethylallyltransferase MiaA n=1 Tax=Pseudonocardia acaciae TaxID=551276 RepID=UPI00048F6FFF|nr:tRNA (adenosine(37)-N6)-dimethylallyltransferase MiaA [Pseudonocardia acaciae]